MSGCQRPPKIIWTDVLQMVVSRSKKCPQDTVLMLPAFVTPYFSKVPLLSKLRLRLGAVPSLSILDP